MIFTFYHEDKDNWQKIKSLLFDTLKLCFATTKDFSVQIGDISRTPKQLRGFYRLCTILVPYFESEYGQFFDKDMVKEIVKQETNYCTMIKGRIITKSLKQASKKELDLMIKKLYEAGDCYGIKDFELSSYEDKALIEYFNKNNK